MPLEYKIKKEHFPWGDFLRPPKILCNRQEMTV